MSGETAQREARRVGARHAHKAKRAALGAARIYVILLDGQGRNRTADTVIFSHVLYQLSYLAGNVFVQAGGRV